MPGRTTLRRRTLTAVLCAVALLPATLTGCSTAPSTPPGMFSVYLGEPQRPLVPGNTTETEGGKIINAVRTPLVTFDEATRSVTYDGAAESVTSSDNVNWTIKLKRGWTFHDGTPVTAESYVQAWNYTALSTNAQGGSYWTRRCGTSGYPGWATTSSARSSWPTSSSTARRCDALTRFVIRRLLLTMPVLIGASLLIYAMVYALPGDPVRALAGDRPLSPAVQAQIAPTSISTTPSSSSTASTCGACCTVTSAATSPAARWSRPSPSGCRSP